MVLMKYICRMTGKKLEFKSKAEYDAHLARFGVSMRDRSRRARPDVSRHTSLRSEKHTGGLRFITPARDDVPCPSNHVKQKFSIIHPSRGRVRGSWNCIMTWMGLMSPYNEMEYILSLDRDDSMKYMRVVERAVGRIKLKVVIGSNSNVVQALNRGACQATGDVLLYVSDDFLCPSNWDLEIQKAVKDRGDDWFLLVNDGIQQKTATLLIESRKYYDRFGYMYYPDYISMWADPDATEVARRSGKLIDATGTLLFKHNHYSIGGLPVDATYLKENSSKAWTHGENLYLQREKDNFGVKV